MMGRLKRNQGQFFYSFCLDEVVPDDHRVREIAGVLDLSWVHAELACYYSPLGRPSIDPVLMIRMLIVGYVYLMMIIGVYATLGVFLLIASKNPYAHKSLIWFTVWSSVVHGAIMGIQALTDTAERGHLVGDVPALILVAIVLAVLMPRTAQA